MRNKKERTNFINKLKSQGMSPVFHYLSLHKSPYYKDKHDGRELSNSVRYEERLIRLPLFYELDFNDLFKLIIK